jgi:hypothetical protein
MLEALEAIEHLGEIARLFLVLARWRRPRMETRALIENCKRTAGLSGRYPRPKPALAIAISAGLLSSIDGFVIVTEHGREFAAQGTGRPELSPGQARLLLAALLDDPEIERAVATLLSPFQQVRGRLITRKTSIPPANAQLLLCRVLQQLGAVTVSAEYYVLARASDDLLGHLVIQTSRLTQAELLKRLERQRLLGGLAEQAVLEIERHRLTDLKRPDLASKIQHVSTDDVSAGYDIRSYEENGDCRLVEVKSSVGSHIKFDWSENERAKAASEGDAYYVYFVPFSFSLPRLTAPVVVIQNPMARVADGTLLERAVGFHVAQAYPSPNAPQMPFRTIRPFN